jgi:hypothetical protein
MTARTRSRTWLSAAGIAALLAPLALVVAAAQPASAGVGKFHEIYMYKVEKHVDISGDFPDKELHEHVYCQPGDIALDGMWRVDSVEQANPPETFGDERDVYVSSSYASTNSDDPTEWHFRIVNHADGKAQVKLFATCIRGTVENAHLHTHTVRVSERFDYDTGVLGNGNYTYSSPHACAPDEYAVAPGFQVVSPPSTSPYNKIRVYRSWPSADFRSWQWAFLVEEPTTFVRLSFKCLRLTTGAANGHAHQIPRTWRPNGYGGVFHNISPMGFKELRVNCDDGHNGAWYQDYKAMVGAWWINDPHHVWFMGMDPRPKQRSFKFYWDGSGDSGVYLGALCVRARTGKQIKPVP